MPDAQDESKAPLIPEPTDRSSRVDRARAIRRTLVVILGLNLLVAATKLTVGFRIDALSLIADGIHSCLDASSNVIGIIGITMASRPPDKDHPYGHRRFETVAAACIGLMIGASLVEILEPTVRGLLGHRAAPEVDLFAVLAVAGTVLVNLLISRYETRRGRELRSNVLLADSQHTMSDALAALAVLAGFGGAYLGFPLADPLAAAVVAGFIGKTAWVILRQNLGVLTDHAALDPLAVHAAVLGVPGVSGAHAIRSRGPSDSVVVDLHIQLDPAMDLAHAHQKTHEVKDALMTAFPEIDDVLIHTEPADGRERRSTHIAPGVQASGTMRDGS